MLSLVDATALRDWSLAALSRLAEQRLRIDGLNVYPVADGDTGSNLHLTLRTAVERLPEPGTADLAATARALARGAFHGARGNSGVILSQWLRGLADAWDTTPAVTAADAEQLAHALGRAADQAYAAVMHPVEGTILTVASAAGRAAHHAAGSGAALPATVQAAADGAWRALERTPEQLEVLRRAGVVDAAGLALCLLLETLVTTVTGARRPEPELATTPRPAAAVADRTGAGPSVPVDTGYEVMYLLETADTEVEQVRRTLDRLGDSLLVVGGQGEWNVHVHVPVEQVGPAIEAGVAVGRPRQIRVTPLTAAPSTASTAGTTGTGCAEPTTVTPRRRVLVCVAFGPGTGQLFTDSGAVVVSANPVPEAGPEVPEVTADQLLAAAGDAAELVFLPNEPAAALAAESAAAHARGQGREAIALPTRSEVQALAALAVHQPERRFQDDVLAMTSAAGATRYAALTTATSKAWTSAGICQPGDVLALIGGDVALIATDRVGAAVETVDRMLASGGELVTLVTGADSAGVEPAGGPPGEQLSAVAVADAVVAHLRAARPEVDAVVYSGGQACYPLLIGVE